MKIEIGIAGETELSVRFLRLSENAADASPALEKVMDLVVKSVRGQIRTKGKRGGTPWPPLAAATLKARRRMGVTHRRPLEVSGRLRESLTSRTGSGDAIRIVNDDLMYYGSSVPYLIYHHSRKPRKHLPRRAVLALTPLDNKRIINVMQKWITKGRL